MVMILRMSYEYILRMQVGPGDDYTVTVGGFNEAKSNLTDSMISRYSDYNINGMKFTTK